MRPRFRPLALAVGAAALSGLALKLYPAWELAFFARGAAELVGLFSGTPILPSPTGWLLPSANLPISVTAACSAADFFVMLAALLGWQLGRTALPAGLALTASVLGAVPLTLAINAGRIIAVTSAHRWVIPLLPPTYAAVLHLFVGAAVFLPALILINLAFEHHESSRDLPGDS